ncbi:MAG: flagellar protein FlaG [Nitrospira sp.]|nr:flagellar protein FlaG [Nitrospira sp.]
MNINSINSVRPEIERTNPNNTTAKVKQAKNIEHVQQQSGKKLDDDVVTNKATVEIPLEKLEKAVEDANEAGQMLKRELNFSVDKESEEVVVKIIDKESGDVVRQIPADEMMRISAHLNQLRDMNDQVLSAAKSIILDIEG